MKSIEEGFSIVSVDRVVAGASDWVWPFSLQRRGEIAAHFAELKERKPALWNGRVLMLRGYAIEDRVFRGDVFETDFADMLAWRDWKFPDPAVKNFFAMGALRGSDGGFILGEMAAHTANAGKVYFPAGTPDLDDLQDGSVDLLGSVMREVEEETGLKPADFEPEPGWLTVLAGPRIALMKVLQATVPAAALRDNILDFISREEEPELSGVHIVHGPDDLSDAMPDFMPAFLRHAWKSD